MNWSRRRFIVGGLAGATALGAGGLGWLRGPAADVAGLKVLSHQAYRTLSVLAATHLPLGGAFAPGGADFDLARLFDSFLADQPEDEQREAVVALHLVEFGPLLFEGRWATFSQLSAPDRLAHWQNWAQSARPLRREIYSSLAKFLGMAFYDRAEIWPHVGYPGPSFARLVR